MNSGGIIQQNNSYNSLPSSKVEEHRKRLIELIVSNFASSNVPKDIILSSEQKLNHQSIFCDEFVISTLSNTEFKALIIFLSSRYQLEHYKYDASTKRLKILVSYREYHRQSNEKPVFLSFIFWLLVFLMAFLCLLVVDF